MKGAGRVALGLAIGLGVFAAFASAAIWALVLLSSLPWQILALCVAVVLLFAWAHWLDSRTARLAQERSAKALRVIDGELPRQESSTTEAARAKGARSAADAVSDSPANRGASGDGSGLRVLRGGR